MYAESRGRPAAYRTAGVTERRPDELYAVKNIVLFGFVCQNQVPPASNGEILPRRLARLRSCAFLQALQCFFLAGRWVYLVRPANFDAMNLSNLTSPAGTPPAARQSAVDHLRPEPSSVHVGEAILAQFVARSERPAGAAGHALEIAPAVISDRNDVGLGHGPAVQSITNSTTLF